MRSKNDQTFDVILACVKQSCRVCGAAPSIRRISAETGVARSTVQRYITAMVEDGTLTFDREGQLIAKDTPTFEGASQSVALLGEVACGLPTLAEENIETYFNLPRALVGDGEFFLLRAKGESMIEAGIDDGDLVLVRKQSYARRGDIAVVLTEDEATLKRFYPEPEHKRFRLHPENSSMQDFYVSECIVQGVAVKVIKDL